MNNIELIQSAITLEVVGNSWISHWSGPESKEMLRLFGTASIPTSFTSRAPAQMVLDRITELNPECNVILKGAL